MRKTSNMSHLSQAQESAIATFKQNLHLPGGGFHALIVDLSKEFQLPFQTVRAVLKNTQSTIEKKIFHQFDHVNESDLTKENWLHLIKHALGELAKDNQPLMESLVNSERYLKLAAELDEPLCSETQRERMLTDLALIYEHDVYKPLLAMLYTTTLYWELSSDLFTMDQAHRQMISDYPQHMEATAHLFDLKTQIESRPIGII
jgi:hypothetical protein